MHYVLTLVATPGGLDSRHVEAARAALSAEATLAATDWLADATACDLRFDAPSPAAAEESVRRALGDAAVDLVAQPIATRRKKLAVFDLESTVIANEMLDDMAAEIGVGDRVADITRRAMNNEMVFEDSLRERVALFAGQSVDLLDTVRSGIVLDPGARIFFATCRAHGVHTALVTGGFDVFAEPLADELGIDTTHANGLEIEDDRLTGRAREPVHGRDTKRARIEELATRYGLEASEVMAVGDGANDLAMLAWAGIGVAYHAKPAVAATARHRFEHVDLRGLLFIQGYRAEEWVTT
ncbi:MAG: phosphoserine phosphatase SerB [Acidobacteriota bacterium]